MLMPSSFSRRFQVLAAVCVSWACALNASAQPTPSSVQQQSTEQAALLTTRLAAYEHVRPGVWPVLGGTVGVLGLAGLVALPLAEDSDFKATGFKASAYAGAALWAAGGAATIFVEEAWQPGVLVSSVSLGSGVVLFGLGFEAGYAGNGMQPYLHALGAGYMLSGALTLISTLIRRPTPPSQLARDYAQLRTPQLRAQRSPAELAAIEARFRLSQPPIPLIVQIAPQWLGALIAGVGAALDRRLDDDVRRGMILLAASMVLPSLITTWTRSSDYAQYAADRQRMGWEVSVSASPNMAGLRATGHF